MLSLCILTSTYGCSPIKKFGSSSSNLWYFNVEWECKPAESSLSLILDTEVTIWNPGLPNAVHSNYTTSTFTIFLDFCSMVVHNIMRKLIKYDFFRKRDKGGKSTFCSSQDLWSFLNKSSWDFYHFLYLGRAWCLLLPPIKTTL